MAHRKPKRKKKSNSIKSRSILKKRNSRTIRGQNIETINTELILKLKEPNEILETIIHFTEYSIVFDKPELIEKLRTMANKIQLHTNNRLTPSMINKAINKTIEDTERQLLPDADDIDELSEKELRRNYKRFLKMKLLYHIPRELRPIPISIKNRKKSAKNFLPSYTNWIIDNRSSK